MIQIGQRDRRWVGREERNFGNFGNLEWRVPGGNHSFIEKHNTKSPTPITSINSFFTHFKYYGFFHQPPPRLWNFGTLKYFLLIYFISTKSLSYLYGASDITYKDGDCMTSRCLCNKILWNR